MTNRTQSFRLGFTGLFVTALITAQFLAVKVIAMPLPVGLPVVGDALLFPAGVVAIAGTFLATDCYTELYGKRAARNLVNLGFLLLLVMQGLLWLAILAPGSQSGVDPTLFAEVLGPSTNIVIGGITGYLLSQHWDVFAFHLVREWTGPDRLWVRNMASTVTSQAVDTVVFVVIAFWLAPTLAGIGPALGSSALAALVLGHYLAKLGLAVLDTPIVYLLVGIARSERWGEPVTPVTD